MSAETAEEVIEVLKCGAVRTLDLTGGAPELNPEFRRLVIAARQRDIEVIDRCNLTVLFEPAQEALAAFLAAQTVTVVASLPCYLEENVDAQRGKGVYGDSVRAIKVLNGLGYGIDPRLQLNLAFNPVGPSLPPCQAELEAEYKRELGKRFGIVFNRLLVITNMPIGRFAAVLTAKGQMQSYMQLLRASFSPANLDTVMCRDTISVDWQGYLYDCDFNQMLRLPARQNGRRTHIRDLQRGPPCVEQGSPPPGIVTAVRPAREAAAAVLCRPDGSTGQDGYAALRVCAAAGCFELAGCATGFGLVKVKAPSSSRSRNTSFLSCR